MLSGTHVGANVHVGPVYRQPIDPASRVSLILHCPRNTDRPRAVAPAITEPITRVHVFPPHFDFRRCFYFAHSGGVSLFEIQTEFCKLQCQSSFCKYRQNILTNKRRVRNKDALACKALHCLRSPARTATFLPLLVERFRLSPPNLRNAATRLASRRTSHCCPRRERCGGRRSLADPSLALQHGCVRR